MNWTFALPGLAGGKVLISVLVTQKPRACAIEEVVMCKEYASDATMALAHSAGHSRPPGQAGASPS